MIGGGARSACSSLKAKSSSGTESIFLHRPGSVRGIHIVRHRRPTRCHGGHTAMRQAMGYDVASCIDASTVPME